MRNCLLQNEDIQPGDLVTSTYRTKTSTKQYLGYVYEYTIPRSPECRARFPPGGIGDESNPMKDKEPYKEYTYKKVTGDISSSEYANMVDFLEEYLNDTQSIQNVLETTRTKIDGKTIAEAAQTEKVKADAEAAKQAAKQAAEQAKEKAGAGAAAAEQAAAEQAAAEQTAAEQAAAEIAEAEKAEKEKAEKAEAEAEKAAATAQDAQQSQPRQQVAGSAGPPYKLTKGDLIAYRNPSASAEVKYGIIRNDFDATINPVYSIVHVKPDRDGLRLVEPEVTFNRSSFLTGLDIARIPRCKNGTDDNYTPVTVMYKLNPTFTKNIRLQGGELKVSPSLLTYLNTENLSIEETPNCGATVKVYLPQYVRTADGQAYLDTQNTANEAMQAAALGAFTGTSSFVFKEWERCEEMDRQWLKVYQPNRLAASSRGAIYDGPGPVKLDADGFPDPPGQKFFPSRKQWYYCKNATDTPASQHPNGPKQAFQEVSAYHAPPNDIHQGLKHKCKAGGRKYIDEKLPKKMNHYVKARMGAWDKDEGKWFYCEGDEYDTELDDLNASNGFCPPDYKKVDLEYNNQGSRIASMLKLNYEKVKLAESELGVYNQGVMYAGGNPTGGKRDRHVCAKGLENEEDVLNGLDKLSYRRVTQTSPAGSAATKSATDNGNSATSKSDNSSDDSSDDSSDGDGMSPAGKAAENRKRDQEN